MTVFAVLRIVMETDGWTDGIGLAKGGNFIGRQIVELCTEIDHWFIRQRIATVQNIRTHYFETMPTTVCLYLLRTHVI